MGLGGITGAVQGGLIGAGAGAIWSPDDWRAWAAKGAGIGAGLGVLGGAGGKYLLNQRGGHLV